MSTSMSLKTEEHKLGVVDPGLRLFGKSIVPAVAAGPMNKVDDAPVHLLQVSQGLTHDSSKREKIGITFQDEDSEVQTVFSSDEAVTTEIKSRVTQRALNPPRQGTPCPRCQSEETKFCYFNNYNVNQPRHFCKGCHRYWTAGGNLRNVPVGAGRRKSKSAHNKLSSSTPETSMVRIDSSDAAQAPLVCSGIAHPEPLHNLPPSSCKVHSQEVVPPSLTAHLVASHDVSDTPPSGITHQVSFHAGEDALPPGGITPVVPFHAKKEQPPPMGTTNPVQFHAKQEDAHPPAGKANPMSFHARQDTCPPIGLTHGVPFHAGQDPPSSSGIDNSDAEGEGHNPATDMPSTNPLAWLCQPDPKWGSANGSYFPLPVPYGGVPWAFMPTFGYPGASSVPPPHPFWNPYGWTVPWAMPWNLRSMSHEIPPHTVKRPRPNPSAPNELTDSLICVPKSLRISDEEVTSGSSILSTLGLSIKVEATSAGFFNGFQPKAEVFQPKPASKAPNPVAFSNSLAFQES